MIGQSKRKVGENPDWAKKGPIDLRNYELRAEWYGATIKQWGDNWPFLSCDPNVPPTADEPAWERYFLRHLEGYPRTFGMFKAGLFRYLNMPEHTPQLFDPSYMDAPDVGRGAKIISFVS
jgi:hypothetical protein